MYDSGPSDEELEAIGLNREDVENTDVLDVWPENWLPMQVFSRLGTQWRVGMGGATGLDYSALISVMNLLEVKKKDRGYMFWAIQKMESAALKQMSVK